MTKEARMHVRSWGEMLLFCTFVLLIVTGCSVASAEGLQSATPTPAAATAATEPLRQELPPGIAAILNDDKYKQATWGLLVVDVETGETVYEVNADKLMVPGSTAKLFSTAAALDALGANYTFTTPVYQIGTLGADGTLDGDLVLVASGDLTMGGRTNNQGHIAITDMDHGDANALPSVELTPQDPVQGLDDLAQQVAAAGIKKVDGNVIIDDRLFETLKVNEGVLSPMVINENLIDIIMMPNVISKTAFLDWRPQTALFKINNQVITVAEGEPTNVTASVGSNGEILVTGQISRDVGQLVRVVSVPNPAQLGRTLFIEALQRAGVEVSAEAVGPNPTDALPADYADATAVARLVSPPFEENIKLTNKVSQNFDANMMPLLLAMQNGDKTFEEGMARMGEFLRKAGVDLNGVSLQDGEGGAPGDYISPRAEIELLRYMATHPDFAAYKASLPILGVDGSLATSATPNSPAIGKVFAKTGTRGEPDPLNNRIILQTKALSGYITTANDRELAFAMMVGPAPVKDIQQLLEIGNDLGRIAEIIFTEN